MKYYIEIALISNEEENLGFIWRKLFTQLHLALVELKDENNHVEIGLSFPKYQIKSFLLGNVLRIFSPTKERLEELKLDQQLCKLEGYIFVSQIKNTPSNVTEYASVSRKQFNTNVERLARRQAKRKNISYEEALKNYENFDEDKNKTKLPYINIKSLSTDKELKIFIEKSIKKEAVDGKFSTYGLSKTSTVPWF